MRLYVFLGIFMFVISAQAAETVVEGTYYGENLVVINSGKDGDFCIQDVFVNGQNAIVELQSNSFEIDFSLMNIKIGTALKIKFIHKAGCKPQIVNPSVLSASNSFAFIYAKANRKGYLQWTIKGDPGDIPFEVEQYRWKKWISLGEVDPADSVSFNKYKFTFDPHSRQNFFRVSHTGETGKLIYTKRLRFSSQVREIFLESNKTKDFLVFTDETMFEVYDMQGDFLLDGSGTEADVTELEKGKYYINYDNKTEVFIKK